MIRKEIIENILDKVNIEEVIAESIELKKRGPRYVGCCPFHTEKTPSFYVFPQTGSFKCFGCGKGGDAISFLMEKENMIMLDKNMNHSGGKVDMSRPKAEAISATVAPFLINSFSFSVNSILQSNSLYILELF